MKKRNVLFLVMLLAIGFAAVSTTLVINGTLNLGFNSNFSEDIVFTRAITPYGNASINGTGKEITFETEKVENIGQKSTLEYDVTNKNRDYDASVTINCGLKNTFSTYSEYVTITQDLTSPFVLTAGETKVGHVTVEMIKAYDEALTKDIEFECKLVASPVERDNVGDEYIPSTRYVDPVLNGADPVLTTNTRSVGKELIPITIKENGEVTYADTNSKWYDYENKEWANAIILIDNPSKTYNVGNIIKEEDIESYFVWIPRYKYQIFDEGNYTTVIDGEPTGGSIAKEIKIEFESKDVAPSNGTTKNSWLTHPAFTNFNVSGLWVGKFETGYEGATTKAEAQVNANDSSKVIIKPNVYSWRGTTLSNMFKTAYNYNRDLDSHMMKNTEWGAVAYLSHSKYGINNKIRINNNSDNLTGYAATDATNQNEYPGEVGTDASKTLPYNTETGYKASTTGNITGIYDLSGGAWEHVAVYLEADSEFGFTAEDMANYSRYIDSYPADSKIASFNKRILGDATGEMGPFYRYAQQDGKMYYHNNWYNNRSQFISSPYSWFGRGGSYDVGIFASQFYFTRVSNKIDNYASSRLVLSI